MLGLLILPLLQIQAAAPTPKRPPDLLALTDQARGLPPEFAADALLRIVAVIVLYIRPTQKCSPRESEPCYRNHC